MNYFFNLTPIGQVQDSTKSNSSQSFMQQNEQGFMQQQSIMSSAFEDKSIDSIVKAKTQKLRVRKKKIIDAYKHTESYLIVKKDSFFFLSNIQNPKLKIFDIDFYKHQTTSNLPKLPVVFQDTAIVENVQEIVLVDSIEVPQKNIETNQVAAQSINHVNETEVITETYISKEDVVENKILARENSSLSGEIWLIGILLSVLFFVAFLKFSFNFSIIFSTYFP